METYVPFEIVKAIPISEILKKLSIEINRSGFCSCPFHNEKTPSMKVYADHAYCFGCGQRADGIGLTAKVLGISPVEAATYLAKEFGIPVQSHAPTYAQIRAQAKMREELQALKELRRQKINEAFKILCAYIRLLTKWEKTLPYNDRRYIWAIHHLNDAINNFDSLMEMSDNDEQKIRCIDFLIKQGFFAQAKEIIKKVGGND